MNAERTIEPFSEDKFQKLYFEHFPFAVKTGIYILKDTATAEDIAQNTFVKLWDQKDKLSEIKNIKSYIVQMTRNACFDLIKENKTVSDENIELEFVEPREEDQSGEMRHALEKALSKLAPQCRLIFSMSRFEGLSNAEIAEYLSISSRTVETQVSMALKRFRTDLRHYFIDFLGLGLLLSELAARSF